MRVTYRDNLILYTSSILIFCDEYTLWRILFEKLRSSQLLKKFHAFYGTHRFITASKRARHLFLSWARSTLSTSHPTSLGSVLILSYRISLGLLSGLLPSGFPIKTLYTPPLSPIRAICPADLSICGAFSMQILLLSWYFPPLCPLSLSLSLSLSHSGAKAQRELQPPHSWGFYVTHNDTPQSVRLLWTRNQPVAETSTWQHKTLPWNRHPWPQLDSNPQFQQTSDLRSSLWTGRPFLPIY
jgi:hypothetical protein